VAVRGIFIYPNAIAHGPGGPWGSATKPQ